MHQPDKKKRETVTEGVCIFCLKHSLRIPDVSAQDCTYGMRHELEPVKRGVLPSTVKA